MLRGTKVVLTEIRPDDKDALFRWINDSETVRLNAPYRPVDWTSHIAWCDGLGSSTSRVIFAVREQETSEIIGTVQLIDIHPVHRSAELVIRIGDESNRGKGLGTEAVRLAIAFAFGDLNLVRVWLRVFSNNGRAIKAYQNAGMSQEGTLRKAAYINGEWLDQTILAVVR
ncbi:GNAT family N-acetyltransferase [Trinickia mobilis]|uniref:GNAT family N-acetyltransferase n=1 Tax=Trinickia mobilis TaxID=2816356 RepID=UPI001A8CB305|nr:GNAT family protein [Trinickia mobilis]